MLAQRLQLEVDNVSDVNAVVDIAGTPQIYLLGAVGLKPFVQQLREGRPVAGERVDRVQGDGAGAAVVRVVDEGVAHDLVWIVAEHGVGPDDTDSAHDVAAELRGIGELAIDVVQEEDLLHSQHLGGGALLLPS